VTDQFLDIEETEQDLSAEAAIEQVLEVVANAKSMPLSSSIIVSRDDVVGLLRTALERLPDELRQARWLLREREEFLAERTREAETLMEEVRAQAERMVQRTEIVRQANSVAQRILDDANDEARTMRHEAEDFCDQKLAGMEIVLDRLTRTVQSGRAKLAAVPAPHPVEPEHAHAHAHGHTNNHAGAASTTEEDGFFDQDVS
jgi:methyl-accepting chemotaxis protein